MDSHSSRNVPYMSISDISSSEGTQNAVLCGCFTEFKVTDYSYLACSNCKKKVNEDCNGNPCPCCQEVCITEQSYCTVGIFSDGRDFIYVSLFDNQARRLFGISVYEMNTMQQENNDDFQKLLKSKCNKNMFIQVKKKDYENNGNIYKGYIVLLIEPDDWIEFNQTKVNELLTGTSK